MESRQQILQKYFAKSDIGGSVSINDLRDKEFNGEALSFEEKAALHNFDRYRINELNKQVGDMDFHECYRHLQVVANLADWREFLKEEYFSED
jgi:hypothetical protein